MNKTLFERLADGLSPQNTINTEMDKYKPLICELAYDMASDEVFRDELFNSESELVNEDGYVDTFQPYFDRWYDLFYNKFAEYISKK